MAAEFIAQAQKLLGRPEEGQRSDAARLFGQAGAADRIEEVYGLQGGRDRRLSDVQGPGPAGRHGDRRQGPNAGRADRRARQSSGTNYDFFFIHFKYTDSTGEDGNFDAKVKRIEELDAAMPRITALKPDGVDRHRRPQHAQLAEGHSWHPVPTLLVADACRTDGCETFGEAESLRGGLGQFEAKYLMPLAMANAGRLGKYGA